MDDQKRDENYHEETFEKTEDTQEVGTQETDTPETDSTIEETEQVVQEQVSTETDTQEAGTQETDTSETDSTDNWETRARYQQSEADKYKNIVQGLVDRLDTEPKEPVQKDILPQKPTIDDPDEWTKYNAEVSEYLLKRSVSQDQERLEEKQQKELQTTQLAKNKQVLDGLTLVTKNPEKSQRIMRWYSEAQNMSDPRVVVAMYDAGQSWEAGQKITPSDDVKNPPPPKGGGGPIDTKKKTPDDEFNDNLGREKVNYRL